MNYFIAPTLSFLLLYKYWALFVLTYTAAVILPIPMNSVLLATGAFASQGYFNLYTSLLIAISTNIAGDVTGYMLARMYGKRALKILRIHQPRSIERFEGYVRHHSRVTIFLTRFIGTLGSLVNFLSGFIVIPFGRFLFFDFLGNIVSVGGVIYAGYFLGIHWQDFSGLFSLVGWSVLVVIIILIFVAWYIRKIVKRPTEKIQ